MPQPIHFQGDRSALREFRCVGEQVEERLPDFRHVGMDGAKLRRQDKRQLVRLLVDERRHHRDHIVDQRPYLYGFEVEIHLAGFDLREVEDVVDESQEMLRRRVDLLKVRHVLVVAVVLGLFLHHFGVADDGVERRPKLMAHSGEELALGGVCGLGRHLRLLQLPLLAFPCGDVLGHRDHPGSLPVRVLEHAR